MFAIILYFNNDFQCDNQFMMFRNFANNSSTENVFNVSFS